MIDSLKVAEKFLWRMPGAYLFPTRPGTKELYSTDTPKHADNDHDTIHRWATVCHPGCNWGVLLWRSGLVVVDIDIKGGVDGEATWMMMQAKHGATRPALTVRTPSGGRHLYWKATKTVQAPRDRCVQAGPGVEFPVWVMIPGSEIDGRAYRRQ